MDKTHTDFLQECEAELALLKERVAALEEKLSAWKAEVREADVPETDIPEADLPEEDVPEADIPETDLVEAALPPVDLPSEDFPPVDFAPVDEAAVEEASAGDVPVEATVQDAAPVDFTDVEMDGEAFGPEVLSAPEETPVEVPAADVPAADVPAEEEAPAPLEPDDTADLPWRKDRPGLQVKNIRSGISLYDRALFIGTLFKEDFTLYDNTIRELNELTTLDQAVDYIRRHFPDWNLHSDVVYSFMMAIRKKLG